MKVSQIATYVAVLFAGLAMAIQPLRAQGKVVEEIEAKK
jgi:hypothetical protein